MVYATNGVSQNPMSQEIVMPQAWLSTNSLVLGGWEAGQLRRWLRHFLSVGSGHIHAAFELAICNAVRRLRLLHMFLLI